MSISIIREDCKSCVKLNHILNSCPGYQCIKDPSQTLNLNDLYQLTVKCFNELNHKIIKSTEQKGGSQSLVGPGPQPSNSFFDGTTISNVKDLYINVRKYMEMHKIAQIKVDTLLPYGIILSTLNLPDDIEFLSDTYPDFIQYLIDKNIVEQVNFETLIPAGIFLRDTDIKNINHLKL